MRPALRKVFARAMGRLAAAALVLSTSAATLPTPRIEQWSREIEARGQGRVIIVEVETSADEQEISFPADTPMGAVLRRYFLEESFVEQFCASHALNINYYGPEGRIHFVLLNLARFGEWGEYAEALLGHELGHAWLSVTGFRSHEYRGASAGCLAVHAGDIVQHILIRQELERRGIFYNGYWVRNLDQALERLEADARRPGTRSTPCETAQRLAMWTDVRLGLSPVEWPHYDRFDATMKRAFPDLAPVVGEMESRLRKADVRRRAVYRLALDYVIERLSSAAKF